MPRIVWVLAAGRLLGSASSFLMLFLTLYLVGPRHLSVGAAGLISGTYGAGMLVGSFTGGWFGDRFGHRPVLLVASLVAGVLMVGLPWFPLWAFVSALPVIAYAAATASNSQAALAALAVPAGERRAAVAVGRAASNAGFVIGPLVGALLISHSFTALLVADGAATLVVRGVTARLLPREEAHRVAREPTTHGLWRSVLADRALLVLLPAIIAVDLVYRQLYTTLPVYLRDQGQPVALYTALIAIGSGLILLLEIPVAVRLRRHAAYPIIAAGYALVGVGMGMFGLHGGTVIVTCVVAMTVLTAGEILYKTTATAHVLDAAPDHLVGQYQGLYTGAATSGTLLSGPIGGAVYSAAPALLWPLTAVVALAAAGGVLVSARTARRVNP
ncbi:MAG TPA: MFS transporter [Pedococcus sp.]|nr:MFS transporter [Pedococcus sp.]